MPAARARPDVRTDPVIEVARRGAVTLALLGGLAMTLASVAQVVTGDATGALTLLGAAPTAIVAFVMRRQERPNVILLLAMITGIAVAVEVVAALQDNTEFVAGIGSEAVAFGLGVLAVFVARERPRRVAVGFLAAALVPVIVSQIHLNGVSLEIATDAVVVGSVMGTLMYLVIQVLDSLSESQARYSDLANVIPIVVYELDITRAVARLQGVDLGQMPADKADRLRTELMGLVRLSFHNAAVEAMAEDYGEWYTFVVGDNATAVRDQAVDVIAAVARGESGGEGEVSMTRLDGISQDFIYQWAATRGVAPASPIRLVISATDVTRLREAETALERQLRERDQFVASVSHELRTPLTSVMGLTEELVSRPEDFDAAEQAELLAIVAAETRDVVDIVEDLLVTARAEAGQLQIHLERCDLSAEMNRIADLMGGEATASESVCVSADPGRLRQVLRNLVSNAQRYGGPNVRMNVARNGGSAIFEIRDDGAPLPEEQHERIFLPYERSVEQNAVGSVGLGLHVARLLARQMGGDLTYTHDGTDTVFSLELQLA